MSLIEFLSQLNANDIEDVKTQFEKLFAANTKETKFVDFVEPGFIIDFVVGDKTIIGVVLANKAALLIDPTTHKVEGYLTNYTESVPYKITKVRKPISESYKYSDYSMPVVWKSGVEMTIEEIEQKLNLSPGTLTIK